MKGPLLLAVVVCAGFILYSRCTDPIPNAEKRKTGADSISAGRLNDSISDLEKYYEKHNNVAR